MEIGVRPALVALKSRLLSVRASARAEFLDEAPFPVREGLRVGVIPLGAADGLNEIRACSALVRGRRVAWLGGHSAEHARLDLTDAPDARVGDEVVIIGRQGEETITLEDVQRHQGGVRASDVTSTHSRFAASPVRRLIHRCCDEDIARIEKELGRGNQGEGADDGYPRHPGAEKDQPNVG